MAAHQPCGSRAAACPVPSLARRDGVCNCKVDLCKGPTPTYRDKFWWLHKFIDEWNKNMKDTFCPSWIICLDEPMVVFTNLYAPGWVAIKWKPHPFGNKYHTISCGLLVILFGIKLVEAKDRIQ